MFLLKGIFKWENPILYIIPLCYGDVMTTETKKPSFFTKVTLWIILALVLLIFAAVIGFNQFIAKSKANAAANPFPPFATVTATTVNATEWTPVIKAVGTIRPNNGAMLSAQAAGSVTAIHIKSGERVTRGQLLIELDSSVEQATLHASESQLPNAKATLSRYRSLVASKSASKAELDKAQATYNQLVANIESLKAAIKRRQIYAPFDGIVGIVKVNLGEYITAATEIVRVEDSSQMKVSFNVPQTNLADITIGQRVAFSVDAIPNQTFEAKVSAIDSAVTKSTGLVAVEAVVDGRGQLMSGMFARLNIALATEMDQVVVPQIAVTYTMYGESAYVLDKLSEQEKEQLLKVLASQTPSPVSGKKAQKLIENIDGVFKARQVEVKTNDRQGIYAQLKNESIKVGTTLVTSGFQRLRNGAYVTIADKQPVGISKPAIETNL